MRTAQIWCIIGILSMILFAQGVAWGTPLTVLNPSFEYPALSPAAWNFTISDWVQSGQSGVWYPGAGYFNGLPPDGNQVAYLNGAGTVISQTLTATPLLPNATYTLQVDLGSRLDTYPFPPGTTVALYAGNNLLVSDSPSAPTQGYWKTDTVTFTSTSITPGIGQNLKIVLTSAGTQADFDNVRLNYVPLPPTVLLLGSGLAGLGLLRFRRRA